MPAYHLATPDNQGVTVVNIGVGPSNAKTITDHLAVLRPQCWLMVGHCGGLRLSQQIGDYVLAHAYLQQDHVLDGLVPTEVPIPALAEVQVALPGSRRRNHRGLGRSVEKAIARWQGCYLRRPKLGVALEARTSSHRPFPGLCGGYGVGNDCDTRLPVAMPYGALLCVSDKPSHGEIKLPGRPAPFMSAQFGSTCGSAWARSTSFGKTEMRCMKGESPMTGKTNPPSFARRIRHARRDCQVYERQATRGRIDAASRFGAGR
jgi:AMP nucleosidase